MRANLCVLAEALRDDVFVPPECALPPWQPQRGSTTCMFSEDIAGEAARGYTIIQVRSRVYPVSLGDCMPAYRASVHRAKCGCRRKMAHRILQRTQPRASAGGGSRWMPNRKPTCMRALTPAARSGRWREQVDAKLRDVADWRLWLIPDPKPTYSLRALTPAAR